MNGMVKKIIEIVFILWLDMVFLNNTTLANNIQYYSTNKGPYINFVKKSFDTLNKSVIKVKKNFF